MHRRHPTDPPAIEQFEPHRPLFLFGDAHGCATELASLLRKAAECIPPGHDEPSTEHVIILASGHRVKLTLPKNVVWLSLGDAFSKGPDPWGIYEIFQSLGVLMVRGNHEHRLLRRQYRTATGVHDGHRRSQQLADTLGANKIQHVVRWIEQSPYIVTGAAMPWMPGKKRWMAVHAGPDMRSQGVPDILSEARLGAVNESLRSTWLSLPMDAEQQQLSDAASIITEVRYLDPHDRLHWSRVHKSDTLVIYGHNPCSEPKFAEIRFAKRGVVHSIGIDTGCVYGGRLSGFWLENGPARLLSVRAQRQYCEIPRKSQMRKR